MRIAFIGLGNMGLPMARNLLRAGHDLVVYNRTRGKAEALRDLGVRVDETPGAAASGAEVVVTMLSDDKALEDVAFDGAGLLERMPRGAVHASMSTIGLGMARRMAEAHARRGQGFVSAPVFGRPDDAERRRLLVVAAGEPRAVELCRPLFETLGRATFVVGEEPSAANVVKLAGNFLLGSVIESLGEAVALTRTYGVDPRVFLGLVADHLFASPVYKGYGARIGEGSYSPAGFRLALGLKDISLALEGAERAGVRMPFAGVLRDHLLTAVAQGLSDADWAALASVSAREAGLERAAPAPGGGAKGGGRP